jgi:hypothetical protein
MLNRTTILGLITLGVLLIMIVYIAITPSPFGNLPSIAKIP